MSAKILKFILICLSAFYYVFLASSVSALRPFVTDDARIIEVGQLEFETWADTAIADSHWTPVLSLNGTASTSFTDYLQVLLGTGLGIESNGETSISNPVSIIKVLIKESKPKTFGLATSFSTTYNAGFGKQYDNGTAYTISGISTYRSKNDFLNLHLNLGAKIDQNENQGTTAKPYWGVGLDFKTPKKNLRYIIEAYAGDPFQVSAPNYAFQTGFRLIKSDKQSFDLITGIQPEGDSVETWVQIGYRMVFNTFKSKKEKIKEI